ncbi:unnamed protein product [Lota lota]
MLRYQLPDGRRANGFWLRSLSSLAVEGSGVAVPGGDASSQDIPETLPNLHSQREKKSRCLVALTMRPSVMGPGQQIVMMVMKLRKAMQSCVNTEYSRGLSMQPWGAPVLSQCGGAADPACSTPPAKLNPTTDGELFGNLLDKQGTDSAREAASSPPVDELDLRDADAFSHRRPRQRGKDPDTGSSLLAASVHFSHHERRSGELLGEP